jgi:antitoxin HigA-1
MNTMRMKTPPHPGRIIRQECLEPLNLTVTAAAKHLRITRQALNNLLNERAGVSPEMAIRLSKAFGSTPEVWLGLQLDYDLAHAARTAGSLKIARLEAPDVTPAA